MANAYIVQSITVTRVQHVKTVTEPSVTCEKSVLREAGFAPVLNEEGKLRNSSALNAVLNDPVNVAKTVSVY